MAEPGESQLLGPASAARAHGTLEDIHREPGAGKCQRRRQAIRARANDDRVWCPHKLSIPCSAATVTGTGA